MTNKKHSHYYKDVSALKTIDVYRVLDLFNVTNPCIQHAVKKLLVAGGRGAGKDIGKDVQESIDSLERWKEMQTELKPVLSNCVVTDAITKAMSEAEFLPPGTTLQWKNVDPA